MSGDTEPILPILDRKAPLLERIRERRQNSSDLGEVVGRRVAELSLEEDEESKAEFGEQIRSSFRRGLSDKLGVPEESINEQLLNEFSAMFVALDETDIVDEETIEDLQQKLEEDLGNDEEEEDESDAASFG